MKLQSARLGPDRFRIEIVCTMVEAAGLCREIDAALARSPTPQEPVNAQHWRRAGRSVRAALAEFAVRSQP